MNKGSFGPEIADKDMTASEEINSDFSNLNIMVLPPLDASVNLFHKLLLK